MSELKDIAEVIISDIMSDKALSDIMLKIKIYAVKQKNKEMLAWANNEINGYENKPPKYRVLDAGVGVDIHRGFNEVLGFSYPTELIEDKGIRDRVIHMAIHQSIAEIEQLCKKEDEDEIHMVIPTQIWYNHMRHCINGDIERAYQFASISSLKSILVKVKSFLIDYFLDEDKKEEINFCDLLGSRTNPTNNITNVYGTNVVNNGSGSISSNDTNTIINGDSNELRVNDITGIEDIVRSIRRIAEKSNDEDLLSILKKIELELKSKSPSHNKIKNFFTDMKTFVSNVGSNIAASKLIPLLNKALSLL